MLCNFTATLSLLMNCRERHRDPAEISPVRLSVSLSVGASLCFLCHPLNSSHYNPLSPPPPITPTLKLKASSLVVLPASPSPRSHQFFISFYCPTFAVSVQDVQRRDEELVGVLLLVAGQVTGVSPHQMEKTEGDVRRPMA